jgi:hypothetical protein
VLRFWFHKSVAGPAATDAWQHEKLLYLFSYLILLEGIFRKEGLYSTASLTL